MKLLYDPKTDSLYIELSDGRVVDSRPLAESVVGDFDASGTLVGLDIENAGAMVDLSRFVAEGIPQRHKVA